MLIIAILSTFITVPLYSFTPNIYGRPQVTNLGFIKDFIVSWWHKIVRRYIYNQVGPAENATANPEQAENYKLPPTRSTANPSDIYELIDYIKDNEAYFSTEILNYLESNNIPNKSAQLELLIVPENIYVTFVWDTVTLKAVSYTHLTLPTICSV